LLGSLIGRESFSQAPIPAKAVQAYILIFRGVPGGAKPPAPPTRALSEGGDSWRRGVLLILHLPQAIYILHCIAFTQTKSFKKRIKYILIHNITLQSFV